MAARTYTQKYYTEPLYSEVEKRIKRYYKVMKNEEGELSHFAQVYLEKIVAEEKLFNELFDLLKGANIGRHFLKAIEFWYEKKTIRPIEEWQPDLRLNLFKNSWYLVAFLFEKYAVAKIFRRVWIHWYNYHNYHEVLNPLVGYPVNNRLNGALFDLYFHLAEGKNIRSWKPKHFRPSKKEAHILMNTPEIPGVGPIEAFWRAVYLAKGGQGSIEFVHYAPFTFEELPFWRQFIGIVVRDEKKYSLSPHEIGEIVHLLQWMKFGKDSGLSGFSMMKNIRGILADFSLKKESIHSIRKKLYSNVQVEYPLPPGFEKIYVFTSDKGQLYQIKHLRNRWELQKEGKTMANCLGDWGYHVEAVKGSSHFWSLRKMDQLPEGTPLVSIEISNSQIIEYQAEDNSRPDDHLIEIIEQWAEETQLGVTSYDDDF